MTADRTIPPLYLIDGHSLTFKAYYGVRGLTSPTGEPANAVYGFFRMLLRLLNDLQPTHLAIIFDTGRETFRREIYSEYKANRDAAPEDFGSQMARIHEMLDAMGIAVHELDGYEADDLLATMAETHKEAGGNSFILTADKDLFQLVDDLVTIVRPGRDDLEFYDAAAVRKKIGVRPDQVVDWLSLVGDASDNIPGVPGVGPKTAVTLLGDYDNLDAVLDAAGEIKRPKLRENLLASRDVAERARRLATIVRDVPMQWDLDGCRLPDSLWTPKSVQLMADLGFDSILREQAIAAPSARLEGSSSAVEQHYETVTDAKTLKAWVKDAMKRTWMALDTETTSTNVMEALLVGISLSCEAGQAIYIPVGHCDGMFPAAGQLSVDETRDILAPLLSGEGPSLSGHHAKYDWKILRLAGFDPTPVAFDTMIASYLIEPDKMSGHGLKALAGEILELPMSPITELIGRGRNQITMAEVAIEDASPYACLDADATLRLTEHFRAALDGLPEVRRVMEEIEIPLIEPLMAMELGGFAVDTAHLKHLSGIMESRLSELAAKIWEAAGRTFNIGSPKQVGEVLFDELGLKTGKKTKTGYSTNVEELERLAKDHPAPRLILEYRGLEKLKSTYADALPAMVSSKTGRIHSTFNQTTAATGRLSSTDPNLQNIPIRTELGRAIRKAFVADKPGDVVLKADYSQIELRILAHVTKDENLREAYRQRRDIHVQTAAELFGVAVEDVTKEQRAQAKTVNFGVIYGISAHGLSVQLGIGRQQAAEFIERYFATYPGVKRWSEQLLAEARENGCVKTLAGRRRLTPDLNSKNGLKRAAAERIAVNTPIQGTCADMIKIAMLRVHEGLAGHAPDARMICQVHDELVFSVPPDQLEAAGEFVRRTMIEAVELDVPIDVDLGHAVNWAEC